MFPTDKEVQEIAEELLEMAYELENDQEAKKDAGKLRLTLVPFDGIRADARIRMYGITKYADPDNWKKVSVERYRDAAFRHFLAYLEDPYGNDSESGLPHLWHLHCNISFLCALEKEKLEEKDEDKI